MPVEFRMYTDGSVGFDAHDFDPALPLVVDPPVELLYSTFLGGSGSKGDIGTGVVVDAYGYVYTAGHTWSTDFPVVNPYQGSIEGDSDVFVSKFTPDMQQLVYSTFIGGSDYEYCYGLAVDDAGCAYVSGLLASYDFPLVNPYQGYQLNWDAFLAKLDLEGDQLCYSTYLGGSDIDCSRGLDVDSSGCATLAGYTRSTDFPSVTPFQSDFAGGYSDCFVTRFAPSGSQLEYSTYVGGSDKDSFWGIALGGDASAYCIGYTCSPDFPLENPFQSQLSGDQDACMTALSVTGAELEFSTFLGGTDTEYGFAVACDPAGRAVASGYTTSEDFPVVEAIQPASSGASEVFVTRFEDGGAELDMSTFLGGTGSDWSCGLACGPDSSIYVTGRTSSVEFPLVNPLQEFYGGWTDAFALRISPSGGNLLFSTYIGGTSEDVGEDVAVDEYGCSYITGETGSRDFPLASPFQPDYGGGLFDAFLSKLSAEGTGVEDPPWSGQPAITILDACPNPFVQCVQIVLSCAHAGLVEVSVLDQAGRFVGSAGTGFVQPGTSSFTWDAAGRPSGVYLILARLEGGFTASQKVVLVR